MKDNFVPIGACMISTLVLHGTGRRSRRAEQSNTAKLLNPAIASALLGLHNHTTKKGN